jgi:hypothetical protein
VVEAVPLPSETRVVLPDDLDLVPRDAVIFVSVRVADLCRRKDVQGLRKALGANKVPDPFDFLAAFARSHGAPPDDLERVTLVNLRPAPSPESYVAVVTTAQPYSRDEFQEQLGKRGLKAQQAGGRTYYGPGPLGHENVCVVNDRTFVYSPREEWLRDWIARVPPPGAGGPLRPGLDLAARRHHVAVGAVLSQLRGETDKQLRGPFLNPPARLARPDLGPLTDAQTLTLTADLRSRADGAGDDGLDAELRLGYADGADEPKRLAALVGLRDFAAAVTKLYATGELEGATPLIAEELAAGLRAGRAEQRGSLGRLTLSMGWEPGWPATAARAVKEEGERRLSLINLQRLAIGMHNYHDARGCFPPAAITDKAGKPLLSWRVAILPYIGEDDLFKQFKLDEAWDGPNNRKLLARMPAVYAPPLQPAGWEPNTTYYQVFTGEQTLFEPGKPMGIANVTDGTSNTLLIVEAFEPVPWTKPDDLSYSPKGKLPALGGIFHDGFQAVMADGRTGRFLPRNIAPATLRALITPNGGELVTPP